MSDQEKNEQQSLFEGLIALSVSSFPKKCANCNKVYQTADEFIQETHRIQGLSGLKTSVDDDGMPIVELFRNCHCGSTLLDSFQERRQSQNYRKLFGELLQALCEKGLDKATARSELVKITKGKQAKQIEKLGLDFKKIILK
ncbi:MAG: hypothetical protein ACJAWS_002939 [Oleiphilaceae bacterium]|jgi:hypothetical protein